MNRFASSRRLRRSASVAAGLSVAGIAACAWPEHFRRWMLLVFVTAIVSLHLAGWLWLPSEAYRFGGVLFVPASFMPTLWQAVCIALFVGYVAFAHLRELVHRAMRSRRSKRASSGVVRVERPLTTEVLSARRWESLRSFDDHGI